MCRHRRSDLNLPNSFTAREPRRKPAREDRPAQSLMSWFGRLSARWEAPTVSQERSHWWASLPGLAIRWKGDTNPATCGALSAALGRRTHSGTPRSGTPQYRPLRGERAPW